MLNSWDYILKIRFQKKQLNLSMGQMGYNQTDLAKVIDFKSRLSGILNKKRKPSLDMIRKISDSLKIPSEILIKAY
jgi:HTH-type transcriptional regulator / antitoxin HigA